MKKRRIVAMAVVAVMLISLVAALVACSNKDYTVSFDSGGGSEVAPMTDVEVIETEPVPTRDGYKFLGWFEDPELTKRVTFPYTVSGDITLYAAWEQIPVEVVYDQTAESVYGAAKDGAVAFGAKAADAVASKSFNMGATLTLENNDTVYDLSLAASVSAENSGLNQAKIQLDKNGAVYLGIYFYNRLLYINDGTGLRQFQYTGDGSTLAFDLAGIISNAVAAFSGSGELLKAQFEEAYEKFYNTPVSILTVGPLINNVLSLLSARETEDGGYETNDLFNSLFTGLTPLGGFPFIAELLKMIGVDLSTYDDIFEKVLGYSYTDLAAGGFSKEVTPFADIRIGAKQAEDGTLEKAWLTRTFGEDVMSLTISGIYVEEGAKDVVDAAAMAQATPGAIHLTAQSYIGALKVYTDIKLAIDLNSLAGNKWLITGGSTPGADDYFTIAYDGAAIIEVKKGRDTDGDGVYDSFGNNINTNPGNLIIDMSAEFVYMSGIGPTIGLPEPTPDLKAGLKLVYPAFDLHDLINTLLPLIGQLTGDSSGTEGETPSAGTEGTEEPEAGGEEGGSVDIVGLLGRIILNDGIGFRVDQQFINDLANIDLYQTIYDVFPLIDTVLGVSADLDNFITKMIGNVFEGNTAAEIADINSLDIVLSLIAGDAFGIGLDIGVYDLTRPDAGELTNASFTLGFCDAPTIDDKFNEYYVGVLSPNVDAQAFDTPERTGEIPLVLVIVETNNTVTIMSQKGNIMYYLEVVASLLHIMKYGGFI